MSDTHIHDIFQQSPTRELEEVQKVNARARAENDVREFYETDSARDVLTTLGNLVDKYPHEEPRFLYISATFGSGKTHLLKLIGFAADTESEFADLGEELANRWPGFQSFRQSVANSHVDRLKPVFLNLLNRDASQEPPLPYLIYEAIGRELGYPTDPNWLLEWAWQLDMNHGNCWERLQEVEYNGQRFEDVYDERASLRSWLYDAVPTLDDSPFASREEVKQSIDDAIGEIDPDEFDPDELIDRVEAAQESLSTPETETELLIGLDEVALFIGDGRHRYREFQETMEALTELGVGPNPPVIGTGQYPIERIHGEFDDTEVTEQPWYGAQEPLEGADTEIIVRKRWLQKDAEGGQAVESALREMPDLTLDAYSDIAGADPDAVESYPFREYDLGLLRTVIQQLMPRGRVTEEEYVQGRALLILVRSLFTRFEWGDKQVGALVTWDELYDLLVEETTYIPLWVQEMVENKLIPSAGGDEDAFSVRVAKALYLLNQVRSEVPSTPANLARLMVKSTDESFDSVRSDVESALSDLLKDRKVLTETNDRGDEEYLLVSEEQEDILTRAKTRAQQIPSHRLSAKLENSLREGSNLLLSEGSRHEVDLEGERKVPLRFGYSVLDPIEQAPTPEFDAVRVRLVAGRDEEVSDQVDAWQSTNEGRDGGEHVLVAVDLQGSTIDRLRDVMGMQEVLSEETETYPDLESDHRDEQRALESAIREQLEEADVYVRTGGTRGRYGDVFEQVVETQVQSVFSGTRFVLTNGITEVEDAKQMAQFFRGVDDWPLSSEDAVTLGVDTDRAELADGWCQKFLDEYGDTQSLRAEDLLTQTVQRGGTYRGTPQESISALLITLATANEIALRRDDEYITEPDEIGRAVRNKTNLTDVQIRFESIDDDFDRIQGIVETLLGREPAGTDVDSWLSELAEWVDENSVLVRQVLRGVSREFGKDASLEELETALQPALGGEPLETEDLTSDGIERQSERFARARGLFRSVEDGDSLWEQFSQRTTEMQRLYPGADVTGGMQAIVGGDEVPDADRLRAMIDEANAHRRTVVREQYERITGESPADKGPESVVSSLATWLYAHDGSSKETADRVAVEFDGVTIDDLYDLFETAWNGDSFSEEDLVDSTVVQQAKRYERARRLLEAPNGEASLWSRLRDESRRLEEERPNHPVTTDVSEMLSRSQPPSVEDVEHLLDEAENPFEVDERLEELASELQSEYPDHDLTQEVVDAVEGTSPPSEERVGELIEDAEQLLDGVDEQLRRIRETMDELEDGSVVLVESLD
ncbi:hypothetical protein HLRTI_002296 [Halorhabdus tiamatea SARL4B]|uniref:Uncharacterized protein n=1 Tax=Halorhabdus tiamatea SARL4B TaxID=1033806 RepID=F7PQU2_9EURY|nr:hypothetical protein [Halorhabdus tiamatea]ERJ05674.1 hypothetical protein HLRTI_002296 [Halorhabdus tiamatea SARL4B]CCQ35172.1 conserved hypothetical protein [Halorhabdus tiamatea SARL4B]